jgi:PAS domain S-box-containing protein
VVANSEVLTDARRAEALRAGQSQILEKIATDAGLEDTLTSLVRLIESQAEGMLGSILLLDPDGVHLRHGAAPSLPAAYNQAIDGVPIGPRAGSCGTAMYRKQPVIVTDILEDPLWEDYRALALPHGLRACWSTPILSSDGTVLGSFAMYYGTPRSPDAAERQLIDLAIHLAGIAIQHSLARETLLESRRQYQALIGSIDGIVWEADATTFRFTFVSPQAERVLGYPVAEWLDQPSFWRDHIHPDDTGWAVAYCVSATQEMRDHDFEYRMVAADGRVVWLRDIVSVVVEQGVVTKLRGVMIDVTGSKRAEEARRQAEEKYRSIVENAVEGIFQSTPAGRFLTANPAMARICGFESPEELFAADPTDLAAQLYIEPARRVELIRELEAHDVVRGFELQIRRRDGSTAWLSETIWVARDPSGAITHYTGMVEDVTGQRRAAEVRALIETRLRQAQKLEAIGQLAGGVAHDFNNILTAILGVADLLLLDLAPDDRRRADVREILDAARRAAALTRQLLAFSRQQVLRLERLDLNLLVTDGERLLRRVIGEDIHITTALDPGLGTIEADPGQLEQVLLNLAVNARDAMPNGGTVTIRTLNTELDATHGAPEFEVIPGPYVLLVVTDTGTGMDRDTQSHLFEPFFTTKGPGKGTGLGLATVYGIVKQNRGYIWVSSQPGQGATFKIYLPRIQAPATRRRAAPDPVVQGGTEVILLVEDEELVRRVAQRALERNGYTVVSASNGTEALAMLRQPETAIDLVVTDLVMPEMGGYRLFEILRHEGRTVKWLFMSGFSDGDRQERQRSEPELPFLQKPWTIDGLLRKVREVLETEPLGERAPEE